MAPASKRRIALLRGINVGGHRRIGMADLRELLARHGYEDVRTHLQSGNVVLTSSLSATAGKEARARARGRARIPSRGDRPHAGRARPGHRPRSPCHVAKDPSRYLVTFLRTKPAAKLVRERRDVDVAPEQVAVSGREVYSWHPAGLLSSPLAKLLQRPASAARGRTATGARDGAARARRRGLCVSWSWEVAERDHEIQDPTSAEKIRLLGAYLRLDESSRVVDLACGKAGPAIVLARCSAAGSRASSSYRSSPTRPAPESRHGLGGLVVDRDRRPAALPARARHLGRCALSRCELRLGQHRDAATSLAPVVRSGGFVAIGEPFWHEGSRSRRRRLRRSPRDRRALPSPAASLSQA